MRMHDMQQQLVQASVASQLPAACTRELGGS